MIVEYAGYHEPVAPVRIQTVFSSEAGVLDFSARSMFYALGYWDARTLNPKHGFPHGGMHTGITEEIQNDF